jgi:hypothetical protein
LAGGVSSLTRQALVRLSDVLGGSAMNATQSGLEWAPVEDSGGVLIMAEEIAAIEFRKLIEVSYDDESRKKP